MKHVIFMVLILLTPLFSFDNLNPEFPPTMQPGPFPLGTETVRNDAPVDETDPDGVLHEYTAYKGTVVVDGNLVTSRTPADLPAFVPAIIEALQ